MADDDLADAIVWLRRELDADEAAAREALPHQTGSRHEGQPQAWVDYLHRFPAARQLAEVEAKRQILAAAEAAWAAHREHKHDAGHATAFGATLTAGRVFDAVLALYADRPGFRDAWRLR